MRIRVYRGWVVWDGGPMGGLGRWNPFRVRFAKAAVRRALKLALVTVVGGVITAIIFLVVVLNGRPDLKVWHEVKLDEEFTRKSDVGTLGEYLELEDRLFAELEEEVYGEIEEEDRRALNRYHVGSLSDPGRWPEAWNRTWVAEVEDATSGVLLLHGMSDSPYSMRALGERMADGKTAVVALRIPGHGTAPSGLLDVRWEDMAAAVKIAMLHLKEEAEGGPVSVVGYSNGGALAVEYALAGLEDADLPRADKLVLISPMVGVTRMAALAVWQSRLGRVLGLRKLAWNAILPEYEPFKYGSFALNAGHQSYRLTDDLRKRLGRAKERGMLEKFPPVLAFQSVVDATVSTPALVSVLFDALPDRGHELVLFDINRLREAEPIFATDPTPGLQRLKENRGLTFRLSVMENENGEGRVVVEWSRAAGGSEAVLAKGGLEWPKGIYSLSHVALPFPETDAVYGGETAEKSPGVQIGNTLVRGERGVLQIPASTMLRLRWNPFYGYMEGRIMGFLGTSEMGGAR